MYSATSLVKTKVCFWGHYTIGDISIVLIVIKILIHTDTILVMTVINHLYWDCDSVVDNLTLTDTGWEGR